MDFSQKPFLFSDRLEQHERDFQVFENVRAVKPYGVYFVIENVRVFHKRFFDTAAADEVYFVKVFFYLGQKRKNRNHVSAAAAARKHDCLVFHSVHSKIYPAACKKYLKIQK